MSCSSELNEKGSKRFVASLQLPERSQLIKFRILKQWEIGLTYHGSVQDDFSFFSCIDNSLNAGFPGKSLQFWVINFLYIGVIPEQRSCWFMSASTTTQNCQERIIQWQNNTGKIANIFYGIPFVCPESLICITWQQNNFTQSQATDFSTVITN